jgi:hypothetical protein
MNTPFIKAGSFRRVLLQALADGAIATIDDLQTALDEPRRKIQDNISHAADAGLCKRLRDDVTGLPAYQISKEGRDYLAVAELRHKLAPSDDAQAVTKEQEVEGVVATEIHAPEDRSQGLEAAYTKALVPPSAKPIANPTEPDSSSERFLIVSQTGRVTGFDDIRSLDGARREAIDQAQIQGVSVEVYRVELVGFAIPPSSATWQDA